MNFDARLKAYYEAIPSAADELKEAMIYSLFTGGKRVRPTLFYTVLKDFGYEGDAAFYFAAAMDDDDFRRGKPSCHKAYGEALAILAGDGLLSQAAELAAEGASLDPEGGIDAMKYLFKAAGTTGMVDGQVLDIRAGASSGDEVIYKRKTGALLGACFAMAGALAGKSKEVNDTLYRVGETLGLSYQFQDDYFDLEEDGAEVNPDDYLVKAREYTEECLSLLASVGQFKETEALIDKILKRDR